MITEICNCFSGVKFFSVDQHSNLSERSVMSLPIARLLVTANFPIPYQFPLIKKDIPKLVWLVNSR